MTPRTVLTSEASGKRIIYLHNIQSLTTLHTNTPATTTKSICPLTSYETLLRSTAPAHLAIACGTQPTIIIIWDVICHDVHTLLVECAAAGAVTQNDVVALGGEVRVQGWDEGFRVRVRVETDSL